MDAKKMTTKIIKEGIAKGNYEITGILETGEIVIAVLSDIEINCLNEIEKHDYDIENFINIQGRPADEILQAYKERECERNNIRANTCKKNRLRFR
ncbi:hypothetical protein ACTQ4K_14995 [Clostridium sporogenes]|uniref:hypothetical protein n=1 Tax=Clostridium sporogenes TaxID=1509 RepID=UPI003F936BF9